MADENADRTGNEPQEAHSDAQDTPRAPAKPPAELKRRILLETAGGPAAMRVTCIGTSERARIVFEREEADALGTPTWREYCDYDMGSMVFEAVVRLADLRWLERKDMQATVRAALHLTKGHMADLSLACAALLKATGTTGTVAAEGSDLYAARKAVSDAQEALAAHARVTSGLHLLILGAHHADQHSPEVIARTLRDGGIPGEIETRWTYVTRRTDDAVASKEDRHGG